MATIREIRAMFTAEAKGIQTAFKQIRQEASKLSSDTKRTTNEVNRHYSSLERSTDKLKQALQETNNVDAFSELTEASERAQRELRETGQVSSEAMDEMERSIQDAARRFNSLGPEARSSFDDVGRAIESMNDELDSLRSTAGGSLSSLSGASSDARNDMNRVGDAAADLDSELRDLGGDNGLQEVEEDANSLGDALGELGGAGGVIAGVGGAFVAASAGLLGFITAGAGIIGFIKSSNELQESVNGLQVSTGATTEEVDEMRESLVNIYGNNFGEGFQDIADSMAVVKQQTRFAGEELEKMTETALLLRDSFGYEVAESTKAASILMKNFGIDGQEAFALIAEGTQKGLNYADDLMDTIGEYSVYYEAAGFSAQEMFGMFENAQKTGAFNLDYAADAFKEFGFIMTEDSDRASEALSSLGLPAEKLIGDFAKGGESARSAFETIATKLSGVKDPLDRTQVGIELFGTKFEDLGADAVLAMAKTNDSVKGTTDTLDSMNDIKYNTILEAIAGVGRAAVANVLIPIQDKIMPGINGAINGAVEKIGPAAEAFKKFYSGLKGLMLDDGQKGQNILKGMGFSEETILMLDGYAAKIAEFRHKFSDFINGISGLFKDDGQAGRDFLASLGLSPELVGEIDAWAANISAFRGNLKNTVDGIRGLFQDDGQKGRDILTALGFTEGFVQKMDAAALQISILKNQALDVISAIHTSWQTYGPKVLGIIQKVLIDLWPKVKSAIAAIVGFAVSNFSKIMEFWNENGPQFLAAVSNIFNGIMKVIQFVMPLVLVIIKSIWGNIKGVITGALDLIMGAVKVFSGLFTGDFNKMWEGLKQMFFGAINFLWNFVQLTFFGKILGGAKVFIGLFRSGFAAMWSGIKALFTGSMSGLISNFKAGWQIISATVKDALSIVVNFIKNSWSSVKSLTTAFINTFKMIFTKGFSLLKTIFTTYINFYRSIITGGWNIISSTTRNVFSGIWNFLKGIFTTIRNWISTSVSGILTKVRDTWSALKTNTTNAFRDIYNGIKSRFTNIVDLAKGLPKRIGDGIGAMASKVTSGVTKVINKLASTLGKGVNGVIGGINWVLGKIGVDEKNYIDKWPVPQYAKGTGGHPGGPMIVGDGTGSNKGPELIENPDGTQMLSPSKPTLMHGEEGTKVWSAKQTKKILEMIPHYKNGDKKGIFRTAGDWAADKYNKGKKKAKEIGGKVKDAALNVFDYVKNPGKLLDLALKTLGYDRPDASGFIGKMASGGWDKVKEKAIGFVKGKLENFGLTQSGISVMGGNGGGFGSPFRLTSKPGPRNTGIPGASRYHKGWDWAAPVGTPIPSVTDGVGHRNGYHPLSGNFVEVKDNKGRVHRYQHNSKNLIKPGQKVKKGQTIALVGATGVGSGPHLHYELKGYEDGGIVDGKAGAQLAWLTEGGWSESVISHDPSKRISQRAIWEETGRELGFDTDNSEVISWLQRIAEGVENGHVIQLNGRKMGETLAPYVNKTIATRDGMTSRFHK